MIKRIRRGFTLLELLVVIGIIGVIMALATVAYSTTQKSGRNTKRKQDLVAVQNALEQYYAANTVAPFSYPDGNCATSVSSYLKSSWPEDPNSPTTSYVISTCSASSYCICATMEGPALIGNSAAACDFSGSKTHYCISNLQ